MTRHIEVDREALATLVNGCKVLCDEYAEGRMSGEVFRTHFGATESSALERLTNALELRCKHGCRPGCSCYDEYADCKATLR